MGVKITETVLRDAHQSLIATRMTTEQMLPIVDKMDQVVFTGNAAVPVPGNFRLTDFMSTAFSMFSGDRCKVKMRFDNSLANAVIDRFGADTMMIPAAENCFTINVDIIPSAAFYGWMCSFGSKAEIIAPDSVREGFRAHLADVLGKYGI